MKATILSFPAAGANRISREHFSHKKRELHAPPIHQIALLLAQFTGIVFAKGTFMKTAIRNILAAMVLAAVSFQGHSQGTLIDQESWPTPIIPSSANSVDGLFLTDLSSTEFMRSFTPSLGAVDFISLEFQAGTGSATVAVNLHEGSPFASAATLLGTTESAMMPAGFVNDGLGVAGVETLSFINPISITPGDAYYFEPVLKSGGAGWTFETIIGDTYAGGVLYVNCYPFVTQTDAWFQEEITAVPEPACCALFGLGLLGFAFKRGSSMLILASQAYYFPFRFPLSVLRKQSFSIMIKVVLMTN